MDDALDWMRLLREAVDAASGTAVAKRLGYSPAVVSQVLKGKYAGRTDLVRQRVIEVYGATSVPCPVLGEIPLSRCAAERNRPFAATNPLRVRLWQTCPTCPFNPTCKPQ